MRQSYSQRNGLTPLPAQFVRNEISYRLRNILLDLYLKYLDHHSNAYDSLRNEGKNFFRTFHVEFLELPANKFSNSVKIWTDIMAEFLINADYNEVLDVLEFTIDKAPALLSTPSKSVADLFKDDFSAFRLINNEFVQLSSEEEVIAVEKAHSDIDKANLTGAKHHLNKSAQFLRKGQWSDSIRESIHSVESVACKISNEGTLGKALNSIEKNHAIHPSLKEGFKKIYGYTSDEQGIRHALIEDDRTPTEQEALFMFSSCASFVSYLTNFLDVE